MAVLWIAGVGAIVAGVWAIWFGVPVKEFSFGNTMILAGVVGICGGLLLIGLAFVARELRVIAERLGGAEPATRSRGMAAPPLPGGSLTPRPAPPAASLPPHDPFNGRPGAGAAPPATPPWRDEAAARERTRPPANEAPEAADAAADAAPAKARRNLLFASSRRERERSPLRAAQPAAAEPPPSAAAAPGEPAKPEPHPSFADAWSRTERARRDAEPRAPRSQPTAAETAAETPPPEAPQQATLVKSGVVDGMEYRLYSDGSIEAQMPEGMMRFASISELRSHLDRQP